MRKLATCHCGCGAREMRYWMFNAGMLADALAAREAERMREGATDQQARDETLIVADFLGSTAALQLRGDNGRAA